MIRQFNITFMVAAIATSFCLRSANCFSTHPPTFSFSATTRSLLRSAAIDAANGSDDTVSNKSTRNTVANGADTTKDDDVEKVLHHPSVQKRAGPLWSNVNINNASEDKTDDITKNLSHMGKAPRKRVLVLCTGGTLTMSNDPGKGNSLAPVQGALTEYLETMREFTEDPEMPEIVSHEYSPLIDSSDMGPGDWEMVAEDIAENYYHFDGFVVLMGTDTMVRMNHLHPERIL